MGYGASVTAPMVIPPEVIRSPYGPPNPGIELPGLVDTSLTGIRLLGTAAKALPAMKEAGSGTTARQRDAAEKAYATSVAFNVTKAQLARDKAIRRLEERATERYAKDFP